MDFIHLIAPKVGAKLELLLSKPATDLAMAKSSVLAPDFHPNVSF
jgi:hypothetical protein